MDSGPPFETYAQRPQTRAVSTSARMEDLKRVVHEMTVREGLGFTQEFSNVHATIKAVEEVSISTYFSTLRLNRSCTVLEGDGYCDQRSPRSPLPPSLCRYTNATPRFQKTIQTSVISVVCYRLIPSC